MNAFWLRHASANLLDFSYIMSPTSLADLPPELLDLIVAHLPTASALCNLGATSKSLSAFVDKDAWQTFNRSRFPSLLHHASSSHRETARSLTALSRAWDRRALVARHAEPRGSTRAYPGGQAVERWQRPRGQTIGFTPQLDIYEEVGSWWRDRKETLAFSAGAEVCVRKKQRIDGKEDVRWITYRPLSAREGRDDVTALHLLRPKEGAEASPPQQLIAGTANGDLRLISLPGDGTSDGGGPIAYFTTQGHPVRSSSLLERGSEVSLLAAALGDSRIGVYAVDADPSKIEPSSAVEIPRPQSLPGHRTKHQRIWSTRFLSPHHVATGIGPSEEPIHIYSLTSSGLDPTASRKISLQNTSLDISRLDPAAPTHPNLKAKSSVYPICPLTDNVFLSGAYDSIIRLHDLRSPRDVEKIYSDPTDDSAIYSLLAHGHETLVAGTSRHSLLKIFDLRLGMKNYSYLPTGPAEASKDWNLFLRDSSAAAAATNTRSGYRGSSRSSQESSVYTLASSPISPNIYAGLSSSVLSLSLTETLHPHPDPAFFDPMHAEPDTKRGRREEAQRDREVMDLAMYDQDAQQMKLWTQKPISEALRGERVTGGAWDERWRVSGAGVA